MWLGNGSDMVDLVGNNKSKNVKCRIIGVVLEEGFYMDAHGDYLSPLCDSLENASMRFRVGPPPSNKVSLRERFDKAIQQAHILSQTADYSGEGTYPYRPDDQLCFDFILPVFAELQVRLLLSNIVLWNTDYSLVQWYFKRLLHVIR